MSELYSNWVPGSNLGTDSMNIFTQSSSRALPTSLKRTPVLMVRRCRTVSIFDHLFAGLPA